MRNIAKILSVVLSMAMPACGSVNDSDPSKAEGSCFEVTPPIDNTAELDPNAGTAGGGS